MNGKLIGGSKGMITEESPYYSDNVKRIQMFKVPGLYPTIVRKGAPVTGVILPAFDNSLSPQDSAYATSYIPYCDTSVKDRTTGFYDKTDWFVPLGSVNSKRYVSSGGVYKYYGTGASTFISPTIFKGGKDPIIDLRVFIFGQIKEGNKKYAPLVTKAPFNPKEPKKTEVCPLPSPSMMYMVNIYGTGSNKYAKDNDEMKNRVLLLGSMTFNALMKNVVNVFRPGNIPETYCADKDFPDMLYGDITNPNRAIIFSSEMANEDGVPYPYLNFGKVSYSGAVPKLECKTMEVDKAVLAGRYNLLDTDNVVHIPSYDEIVDLIVSEGLVPYHLVEEVCASKCTSFPSQEGRPADPVPEDSYQYSSSEEDSDSEGSPIEDSLVSHREDQLNVSNVTPSVADNTSSVLKDISSMTFEEVKEEYEKYFNLISQGRTIELTTEQINRMGPLTERIKRGM